MTSVASSAVFGLAAAAVLFFTPRPLLPWAGLAVVLAAAVLLGSSQRPQDEDEAWR